MRSRSLEDPDAYMYAWKGGAPNRKNKKEEPIHEDGEDEVMSAHTPLDLTDAESDDHGREIAEGKEEQLEFVSEEVDVYVGDLNPIAYNAGQVEGMVLSLLEGALGHDRRDISSDMGLMRHHAAAFRAMLMGTSYGSEGGTYHHPLEDVSWASVPVMRVTGPEEFESPEEASAHFVEGTKELRQGDNRHTTYDEVTRGLWVQWARGHHPLPFDSDANEIDRIPMNGTDTDALAFVDSESGGCSPTVLRMLAPVTRRVRIGDRDDTDHDIILYEGDSYQRTGELVLGDRYGRVMIHGSVTCGFPDPEPTDVRHEVRNTVKFDVAAYEKALRDMPQKPGTEVHLCPAGVVQDATGRMRDTHSEPLKGKVASETENVLRITLDKQDDETTVNGKSLKEGVVLHLQSKDVTVASHPPGLRVFVYTRDVELPGVLISEKEKEKQKQKDGDDEGDDEGDRLYDDDDEEEKEQENEDIDISQDEESTVGGKVEPPPSSSLFRYSRVLPFKHDVDVILVLPETTTQEKWERLRGFIPDLLDRVQSLHEDVVSSLTNFRQVEHVTGQRTSGPGSITEETASVLRSIFDANIERITASQANESAAQTRTQSNGKKPNSSKKKKKRSKKGGSIWTDLRSADVSDAEDSNDIIPEAYLQIIPAPLPSTQKTDNNEHAIRWNSVETSMFINRLMTDKGHLLLLYSIKGQVQRLRDYAARLNSDRNNKEKQGARRKDIKQQGGRTAPDDTEAHTDNEEDGDGSSPEEQQSSTKCGEQLFGACESAFLSEMAHSGFHATASNGKGKNTRYIYPGTDGHTTAGGKCYRVREVGKSRLSAFVYAPTSIGEHGDGWVVDRQVFQGNARCLDRMRQEWRGMLEQAERDSLAAMSDVDHAAVLQQLDKDILRQERLLLRDFKARGSWVRLLSGMHTHQMDASDMSLPSQWEVGSEEFDFHLSIHDMPHYRPVAAWEESKPAPGNITDLDGTQGDYEDMASNISAAVAFERAEKGRRVFEPSRAMIEGLSAEDVIASLQSRVMAVDSDSMQGEKEKQRAHMSRMVAVLRLRVPPERFALDIHKQQEEVKSKLSERRDQVLSRYSKAAANFEDFQRNVLEAATRSAVAQHNARVLTVGGAIVHLYSEAVLHADAVTTEQAARTAKDIYNSMYGEESGPAPHKPIITADAVRREVSVLREMLVSTGGMGGVLRAVRDDPVTSKSTRSVREAEVSPWMGFKPPIPSQTDLSNRQASSFQQHTVNNSYAAITRVMIEIYRRVDQQDRLFVNYNGVPHRKNACCVSRVTRGSAPEWKEHIQRIALDWVVRTDGPTRVRNVDAPAHLLSRDMTPAEAGIRSNLADVEVQTDTDTATILMDHATSSHISSQIPKPPGLQHDPSGWNLSSMLSVFLQRNPTLASSPSSQPLSEASVHPSSRSAASAAEALGSVMRHARKVWYDEVVPSINIAVASSPSSAYAAFWSSMDNPADKVWNEVIDLGRITSEQTKRYKEAVSAMRGFLQHDLRPALNRFATSPPEEYHRPLSDAVVKPKKGRGPQLSKAVVRDSEADLAQIRDSVARVEPAKLVEPLFEAMREVSHGYLSDLHLLRVPDTVHMSGYIEAALLGFLATVSLQRVSSSASSLADNISSRVTGAVVSDLLWRHKFESEDVEANSMRQREAEKKRAIAIYESLPADVLEYVNSVKKFRKVGLPELEKLLSEAVSGASGARREVEEKDHGILEVDDEEKQKDDDIKLFDEDSQDRIYWDAGEQE